MNKNDTDLTVKIEKLKQLALKSGNTFVVDMINSNKNPNDLFFENMNKMMKKSRVENNTYIEGQNEYPIVEDNTEYLELVKPEQYTIFNSYKNVDNFFKYAYETDNKYIIKSYDKIEIKKNKFFDYLFRKMKSLFNYKEYYEEKFNDIDYANILLNESRDELKSKIESIIVIPYNKSTYYHINLKLNKLGNKLKYIILKYKIFNELMNYINKNIDKIEIKNNSKLMYYYLILSFNNIDPISNIILKSYMPLTNNEEEKSIIKNVLKNIKVYDNNYLKYLSDVIIDNLLFSDIRDDTLNNLKNDNKIFNHNFITTYKRELATFILTTCLFIGKEEQNSYKKSMTNKQERMANSKTNTSEEETKYIAIAKLEAEKASKYAKEAEKYAEEVKDVAENAIKYAKEVKSIIETANNTVDEIDSILNDVDRKVDEVNSIVDNVNNAADNAIKAANKANKAINKVDRIVDEVDSIVDKVNSIIDKANIIISEADDAVDKVIDAVDEVQSAAKKSKREAKEAKRVAEENVKYKDVTTRVIKKTSEMTRILNDQLKKAEEERKSVLQSIKEYDKFISLYKKNNASENNESDTKYKNTINAKQRALNLLNIIETNISDIKKQISEELEK